MKIQYSWFKCGRICACCRSRKKVSAFTLLELLIVIVIISIVCLISAPHFQQLYQKNKFTLFQQRFLMVLRYARNLAIQSGAAIEVEATAQHLRIREQATKQMVRDYRPALEGLSVVWRGSGQVVIFAASGATQGQQGSYWLKWKQYHARIVVTNSGRIRHDIASDT